MGKRDQGEKHGKVKVKKKNEDEKNREEMLSKLIEEISAVTERREGRGEKGGKGVGIGVGVGVGVGEGSGRTLRLGGV